MCLSLPARILSIEGDMAEVSAGGAVFNANVSMIENPAKGDYILLHAGFAITRISQKEAAETLRLIKEMKDLSNS
jgi:hydrogenase expression/formation protein HypC